jgi:hypothetical protein
MGERSTHNLGLNLYPERSCLVIADILLMNDTLAYWMKEPRFLMICPLDSTISSFSLMVSTQTKLDSQL